MMRKGITRGIRVRGLSYTSDGENGKVIYPNNRLNNTESVRFKLQPQNSECACLGGKREHGNTGGELT